MATVDVLGESVTQARADRADARRVPPGPRPIVGTRSTPTSRSSPRGRALRSTRSLVPRELPPSAAKAAERDLRPHRHGGLALHRSDAPLVARAEDEFPNVGVVLQAYLRRTLADIDRLVAAKMNVRICKGIYVEPREIAYKDRQDIIGNYAAIVDKLLSAGCYVGIATHDEACVRRRSRRSTA